MRQKFYQRITVEAERFYPHVKPWPPEVIAWTDMVPRDMSWGYVINPANGAKMHIGAGDWIVFEGNGGRKVIPHEAFTTFYQPNA